MNSEEFYTALTRVEACLNTLPIIVLSSDVNELLLLTRRHFFFGQSLDSVLEPNLLDIKPKFLKP